MNILKRLFPTKQYTNYPNQSLDIKQHILINYLDTKLVDIHPKEVSGDLYMRVFSIKVGLRDQWLSNIKIEQLMAAQINTGVAYVPRSIAFIVEPDGTWLFLYAVRDHISSNELCISMFFELLTRTNNAR